ncbi:Bifunctional enzyme MurC/Ddl [Candidatus Clavichlamydia salmonicola]|uniref:UDP-N-acetylmuramate--L-alanine ligase n=1 Tax=Candidatus Clavichlamydia salmonicola TaxID=469812 RepID=UPI00189194FB|nr:UDP-N-acetylmuramate--L-alanine ligase [Candidatus Clavichlamydia salmonicola]MBF5050495.1 Bifunctional enzyme MurC/Ddl [Candidatus Clavichlamydia salmonicola]
MINYHLIGIGGIGMSSLARILLAKNHKVSGSDLNLHKGTDDLVAQGANIFKGHVAAHIPSNSIVVYSSAISVNNEEYQEALVHSSQMMHRAELLATLMEGQQSLVVTGSHGKTTTSALLTFVLQTANKDFSFSIGGMLQESNGTFGKGPYFVAELDESDGSLKYYQPFSAIITNLDKDHLNYHKTMDNLRKSINNFIQKVKNPEYLLYNGDCLELAKCSWPIGSISYGCSDGCAIRLSNYRIRGMQSLFDLNINERSYHDILLNIPGVHNVSNAIPIFALCLMLGISEKIIRQAFATFPGVARRLEQKQEIKEVLFLDDYAHHPTAINATLKSLYELMPHRRLIAIFQPHRFSRLQHSWSEFKEAFGYADIILVTDMEAAGEDPIEGISSIDFVKSISKTFKQVCRYVPRDAIKKMITELILPYDICITLGAGDINYLHDELKDFVPRSLKIGFLFGGPSYEHDISILSARHIINVFDKEVHEVIHAAVNLQLHWEIGERAEIFLQDTTLSTIPEDMGEEIHSPVVQKFLKDIDVIYPMLHGTFGEDGYLQALAFIYKKPIAGPSFSYACSTIDKVLTKRVALQIGVPTVPFLVIHLDEWKHQSEQVIEKIVKTFDFPFFVKASYLGSSVGTFCVYKKLELKSVLQECFSLHNEIIIEESRLGCREIEFSFLGDAFKLGLLEGFPAERLSQGCFLDYNYKYGLNGVKGIKSQFIDLSDELIQVGRQHALKIYQAMGATGLGRVDFFLDENNQFWFSEINSIPGCTLHSTFTQSLEKMGITPKKVIEHLLALSIKNGVI